MREIRPYIGIGALALLGVDWLASDLVPALAADGSLAALVEVGRVVGWLFLGFSAAVVALVACLVALAWVVSIEWLDRVRVRWLFGRGGRW